MTFFDCRADLVGQLSRDKLEGMLQIDAGVAIIGVMGGHVPPTFWLVKN